MTCYRVDLSMFFDDDTPEGAALQMEAWAQEWAGEARMRVTPLHDGAPIPEASVLVDLPLPDVGMEVTALDGVTARVCVVVPAGEYWLGDPCYTVPDRLWMGWLEAVSPVYPTAYFPLTGAGATLVTGPQRRVQAHRRGHGHYTNSETDHVLAANIDGHMALGVHTMYGDGLYYSSGGHKLPVDAGLIGLVDVRIAPDGGPGVHRVTFTESVRARYVDGVIHLGDLTIDTTGT